MTDRFDVERLHKSLSIMDCATASVTAVNWYNYSATGGMTPRRTLAAGMSTTQIVEYLFALTEDLFKKR